MCTGFWVSSGKYFVMTRGVINRLSMLGNYELCLWNIITSGLFLSYHYIKSCLVNCLYYFISSGTGR